MISRKDGAPISEIEHIFQSIEIIPDHSYRDAGSAQGFRVAGTELDRWKHRRTDGDGDLCGIERSHRYVGAPRASHRDEDRLGKSEGRDSDLDSGCSVSGGGDIN